MDDYNDLLILSHEELLEEYCKLYDTFRDFRDSKDADKQNICDLKRSLDIATANQKHLSEELEQYINCDNKEKETELQSVKAELAEEKIKYRDLQTSFTNLQDDYSLLSKNTSQKIKDLEELLKCKEHLLTEVEPINCNDYILQIETLEDENMDLLGKIESFEERSVAYTLKIAEQEKNIEILKDQLLCLEENLKSKRKDLEEKNLILESTQEQLFEAVGKIAMLSAAPDNDRKGNSLFAEVDDQRQAMKQMLVAHKRNYTEMKKLYRESEHEIRRLKRENISMRTELEACSAIFCSADKIYQEKLNKRIHYLLKQNEEVEGKLKWTQERLNDLAAGKGVLFFDSMLRFCRKETNELKTQLHSERIQNASLDEQLRNSQQDMARWRFQFLKSQCVLMDREYLLTENEIAFKSFRAFDFNISEKDQEKAQTRAVTSQMSSLVEHVIQSNSLTPSKEPINQETESQRNNLVNQETILKDYKMKKEQKEQLAVSNDSGTSSIDNLEKMSQEKQSPVVNSAIENNIELKPNENIPKNNFDDKENIANNIDDIPKSNKFAKLKARVLSPMRPSQRSIEMSSVNALAASASSILIKENEFLFKKSTKSVKFSTNRDTVYNLFENASSPTSSLKNFQSDDTTTQNNNKRSVKHLNSKRNIVVRRVIVGSKPN